MSADEDVCPVCNGTLRQPAFGTNRQLAAGYDANTDTFPCQNCGGQRMFGKPTGVVPLDRDGNPCHHAYEPQRDPSRSSIWHYTCHKCNDTFLIDTGD